MDKLFKYGLSPLFLSISLAAIKKYQVNTDYSYLDASSFSVHGEYLIEEHREESSQLEKERIRHYKTAAEN